MRYAGMQSMRLSADNRGAPPSALPVLDMEALDASPHRRAHRVARARCARHRGNPPRKRARAVRACRRCRLPSLRRARLESARAGARGAWRS